VRLVSSVEIVRIAKIGSWGTTKLVRDAGIKVE
jgi:hypothetical protein